LEYIISYDIPNSHIGTVTKQKGDAMCELGIS